MAEIERAAKLKYPLSFLQKGGNNHVTSVCLYPDDTQTEKAAERFQEFKFFPPLVTNSQITPFSLKQQRFPCRIWEGW